MMVKNGERYHIEGVLSFVKGCDRFAMGADEEKEKFVFTSLAYTKLSCYMSWVAGQFGLSYDDHAAEVKPVQYKGIRGERI